MLPTANIRTPPATTQAAATSCSVTEACLVKSTVAITTYWALGTQENGEVLSSDSY